jgi:hypothetical protein
LHTQMPQRRQWWRRFVSEKGVKQSMHSFVVSSGTLAGAATDTHIRMPRRARNQIEIEI